MLYEVITSMKGRALASSPVLIQLEGKAAYQEAIIRCDAVYLRAILDLSEFFDLDEATIALYDDLKHKDYIQNVLKKWMKI